MPVLSTLRRTPYALVTSLAVLSLAACSGSSAGGGGSSQDDFTSVPAKNLPQATALAKDGSTVSAGTWGVVKYGTTDGKVTVMAIKVTDVRVGKCGALKDLRGVGDMSTTTPFYVSFSWAPMKGDPQASPIQSLSNPEGSTLSVPRGFAKCKTPAALDYTGSLGDEQHGCAVLAATSGVPTSMVFDPPRGSQKVSFALPAGA
jgi:hypothetical protein